jgi:hypothetical protein
VGNGPHKTDQFPGNRHDHLVGMFPPGHEASKAFTQAHWRLPPDVLDGFGLVFKSQLQRSTDFGRVAIRPGTLDECSTGMGIPGLGEGPLPAAFTTGVCRGDEPQEFHQWSGILKACEVAQFSHGGDGPGELDTT